MQDPLIATTAIAVLLFVGVICSWIGKKLKVPDALLLIFAGIAFGHATFNGEPLVAFPDLFLSSLAILALALIVFDGTARIRLRELDTFSVRAINLVVIFTLLLITLFSAATHYILGTSWWISILFAAVMTGTSAEAVLPAAGKGKAGTLIKLESVFNDTVNIVLPFLIIDLMQNVTSRNFSGIMTQLTPVIMQIIVGIGTGVFCGIILFKLVQHVYAEIYSPLAVIVAALLAYVLAENLGGSGVLAVTSLGLFFGNAYVKEKITILGVESVLAKALYVLVFMLAGLVINIPLHREFLITSSVLFGIYCAIRFLAVWLSTRSTNIHDLAYMTLAAPKGITTTAVLFTLATLKISGIELLLQTTFAFILYSMIVSAITIALHRRHSHENHTR